MLNGFVPFLSTLFLEFLCAFSIFLCLILIIVLYLHSCIFILYFCHFFWFLADPMPFHLDKITNVRILFDNISVEQIKEICDCFVVYSLLHKIITRTNPFASVTPSTSCLLVSLLQCTYILFISYEQNVQAHFSKSGFVMSTFNFCLTLCRDK